MIVFVSDNGKSLVASYVGYTGAVGVLLKAGADKLAVNKIDSKTARLVDPLRILSYFSNNIGSNSR